MIGLPALYILAGAMFAAFALLSALDRSHSKRFGNAAFWGLMALSLLGGDAIGDLGNGVLVLCLAGLAGFGFIGRSNPPTTSVEEREAISLRFGAELTVPEIAKLTGEKLTTVEGRVYRALRKLREELDSAAEPRPGRRRR